MSFQQIRRIEGYFQPAAVGSNETTPIFAVKAGQRVMALWIQVMIAGESGVATSTIEIGDGTNIDGYLDNADINTITGMSDNYATTDGATYPAGTILDGNGEFLVGHATSGWGTSGKLYTVDDTVDAVYTANTAGATNPKIKWFAWVAGAN